MTQFKDPNGRRRDLPATPSQLEATVSGIMQDVSKLFGDGKAVAAFLAEIEGIVRHHLPAQDWAYAAAVGAEDDAFRSGWEAGAAAMRAKAIECCYAAISGALQHYGIAETVGADMAKRRIEELPLPPPPSKEGA